MFARLGPLICIFTEVSRTLFAAGKVLTSPADISSHYDFVIIGGGTAGSVLANRLSEKSSLNILVVEAGASADGILAAEAPFLGTSLSNTVVDWNFTTTAQPGLNNRSIPYERGHVLGGSSVLNLMTWNRASIDMWNRWARLTLDPGWSWDAVSHYYNKTNRLVASADGHNTTGQVITADYGNGPVEVSIAGFATELDSKVIESAKELGGRFAFNQDFNSGNNVGVGYMPSSIGGGQRSQAAIAYLEPVENRTNIDILINTRVVKISPTSHRGSHPVFGSVELIQISGGTTHTVQAKKEVILSAGVIGTPQILLRSGIGPKNTLESLGIDVVIDLAEVGQNLFDHPLVPNYFYVNSNNTLDSILRNATIFDADLAEWLTNKTGPFVDSPGNTQAYIRLPSNSSLLEGIKDPAAGSRSAHMEWIFVDFFAPFGSLSQPAEGSFMTVLTSVASPTSRGSVSITSTDPFEDPAINPAVLTSNFDIGAMVQAMKDVQKFITASPWDGFVAAPFGALANATTDVELAEYARNNGVTVNHPVGTARMSSELLDEGVTNSWLQVKGAVGLRIVDASVFPAIPECHVQAPVYVVAERAADLIKLAWTF